MIRGSPGSLIAIALLGGLAAVIHAAAVPVRRVDGIATSLHRDRPELVGLYRADSIVPAVVAHDLFRRGRHPAGIAYNALELAGPTVARPSLTLSGIIAGIDPSAIVEGLPGTAGPRVVHRGEKIGQLKVSQITERGVVVRGLDTSWTLQVQQPWK